MVDYTPLDGDDIVIPVGAAVGDAAPKSTPAVAPAPIAPAPAMAVAPTLMSHDDEIIPVSQPQSTPAQGDVTMAYRQMFADPTVTGDQLRAYYKQISGKDVSPTDDQIITNRDTYRSAHPGAAGDVQVADEPFTTDSDNNVVDTRPTSFEQGARDSAQNILSNVSSGIGYLGNGIGLANNIGGDVRQYFAADQAKADAQGSTLGRIAGAAVGAAPLALLAAPVATGVGALGVGAGLSADAAGTLGAGAGMFADGALQGAATTNAQTPGGVAKDALIGGTLGTAFGGAGHALATLAGTPTVAAQAGRDVLDTADRLGVRPLPADVGGALTRGVNAAGLAGIVSNVPITLAEERYISSLQGVRDRAAQSFLPAGVAPRDVNAVAGDALNGVGGLGDYEARSAEQGGKMFDNASMLAGPVQVPAPRALAAVNSLIARGEAQPGDVPGLAALRSLRDDLTPTDDQVSQPSIFDREFGGGQHTVTVGNPAQFSIDTLRRLRTSFGDNFDSGQRAARESANSIWGPLSQDIDDGLRAAGRGDAADAYQAANQNWAQRQQNLDTIVNPILGNRSQEQLAKNLTGMTQTNHDLLNQGLNLMAHDQAAHVRAALVSNLGRANSGVQNAVGDRFSIANFGTDWDKLSDGLKSTMLNGQAGQQLQDLARLSEAAKTAGRYKNSSNTARSEDALRLLRVGVSGLVGAGGELAGGALTAGGTLAAQGAVGLGLSSPSAGRGLVRLGEVRPFANSAAALAKLGQYTAPVIPNQ